MLFDPIAALDKTIAVLRHAAGLGHPAWPASHRSPRAVSWTEAAARLWPHTAVGVAVLAPLLAAGSGFALAVGLPAVAGLVLAIPFCVLTARPVRV